MSRFTKSYIYLRDSSSHNDYNKRILEYLNDRHTAINDNGFTIAIEVVDDGNIDHFVAQGMESVPALKVDSSLPYMYGVNTILSELAKLEISQTVAPKEQLRYEPMEEPLTNTNSYDQFMMQEMLSNTEEETLDAPPAVKGYREQQEGPMTEKFIEEKMKSFDAIYRSRGGPQKQGNMTKRGQPQKGVDIEKMINNNGDPLDKGEAMLMRQIARSLA